MKKLLTLALLMVTLTLQGYAQEVIHLNPMQSHLKNLLLLALTLAASILTCMKNCRDEPKVHPHCTELRRCPEKCC